MCTENPAKAIGAEHRLGSLGVGRQADISVLDIRERRCGWCTTWLGRQPVGAERAFVPVLTVKRGQVFEPDWGPRPWGWEPDKAPLAGATFNGCC